MGHGASRRLLLILTLAAAAAALFFAGWRPAREALHNLVLRAVDRVRLRERGAQRLEEAPLTFLAASQVGYGPAMRKQFTSPAAFDLFVVEDARSGAVVWKGRGPVRTVRTDLLGSVDPVWIGDFSALETPGRYRLRADNGLTSRRFSVGQEVFDAPLRAVQRWFYYQRAFTSVGERFAEGPWIHPDDGAKAPPGVEGGWHDAGDFSIYSASLNPALFWLLSAAADFSPRADDFNVPESGNGIPDLLDEAQWGLRWLLSVQDGSGGFQNSTCQESYGPYGTNTPNSVPPYRSGEIGTFATARAVGNLAFAAFVYRPVDPRFAERCLQAAWKGVRYLDAHPTEDTDGPTCPAARRDGDTEVGRRIRLFAAGGMLLATGEPRFRNEFATRYTPPPYDPTWLYLDGHAALLYLRAPAGDPVQKQRIRARLRANADQARAEGNRHPFQWASRYHWGSVGAGFQRAALSSAPMCLDDPAASAEDCEQAVASLHYALGRNSLNFSYVSGLPGVERGMSGGFHHWLAALDVRPRDFPGMIAGGPNQEPEPGDLSNPHAWPRPIWAYWGDPALPRGRITPIDGRYTDNDSWSTNEPSVEWEAEAVYLLHLARWLARGGAPTR